MTNIADKYEGDGYEISVRTHHGRVLVHVTASACASLGRTDQGALSAVVENHETVAALVTALVHEPCQMRVTITRSDVLRFRSRVQ